MGLGCSEDSNEVIWCEREKKKKKKRGRIASHNFGMILEFSKYEWYCNCLYGCSCMSQIPVVMILVMFIWLIIVEFKSNMYFVLIMKHVWIWCEELPRLKRDVIGFEIELEVEFLSDPEWSTGRPTNLPARDCEAYFCFILFITSPLPCHCEI